jgi:hypothetical protein
MFPPTVIAHLVLSAVAAEVNRRNVAARYNDKTISKNYSVPIDGDRPFDTPEKKQNNSELRKN